MSHAEQAVLVLKSIGARISVDSSGEVTEVDCSRSTVADKDLHLLKDFARLENLSLAGTVTDDGLRQLQELDCLRILDIRSPAVKGPGFRFLGGLPNLEELHLRGSGIEDVGLRHLNALNSLRILDISDTACSDLGLDNVRELLMKVEWLDIGRTQVTDRSLQIVSECKSLTNFDCSATCIGDEGVMRLPYLSRLQFLYLNDTKVSDVGMEVIGKVTTLEWLEVATCRIGDVGIVYIRHLAKLRGLVMKDTGVTDHIWPLIHLWKHLTYLDVGGTHVTKDAIQRMINERPEIDLES